LFPILVSHVREWFLASHHAFASELVHDDDGGRGPWGTEVDRRYRDHGGRLGLLQ